MKSNPYIPVFHVVDSAAHAYRFVWQNRALCLSIAALPFLIKIGCLSAILFLGLQDNHLRQGLLLLPSYFAEGWMAGLLVRMTMEALAQKDVRRDVFSPTARAHMIVSIIGPAEKQMITAGMIVYVLAQIVYAILTGAMASSIEEGKAGNGLLTDSSPAAFIFGLVMLTVMIWSVRLAWLYVPITMGYNVKHYLRSIQPFIASFYMIGISLLCSVPVGIVVMLALKTLAVISASLTGGMIIVVLVSAFLQTVAQLAAALIGTIAMAFALYPLLKRPS